MENVLNDMAALAVKKRTVAVVENGTWAPAAGRQIIKKLEEMKEMKILDMQLSLKSTLKNEREEELDVFVKQIVESM